MPSEEEKTVFRAAAERRKAIGMKLKRVTIAMSEQQVADWSLVYDALVEAHGKNEVINFLIYTMARAVTRTREAKDAGLLPR